jgi:maltose O-acetyltransferase
MPRSELPSRYRLLHWLAAHPLVGNGRRNQLMRLAGDDIDPTAHVFPGSFFMEGPLHVGPGCWIHHGCYLDCSGGVHLDIEVGLSPGVKLLTTDHLLNQPGRRFGDNVLAPIRVGAGTWIGANVVVLPGVTIGPGCVIGAGAVVRADCEANGVYAGVPARRRRDLSTDENLTRRSRTPGQARAS